MCAYAPFNLLWILPTGILFSRRYLGPRVFSDPRAQSHIIWDVTHLTGLVSRAAKPAHNPSCPMNHLISCIQNQEGQWLLPLGLRGLCTVMCNQRNTWTWTQPIAVPYIFQCPHPTLAWRLSVRVATSQDLTCNLQKSISLGFFCLHQFSQGYTNVRGHLRLP